MGDLFGYGGTIVSAVFGLWAGCAWVRGDEYFFQLAVCILGMMIALCAVVASQRAD